MDMIKQTVSFLNEALKQDNKSVSNMFLNINIPANQEMIEHPTIQVTHNKTLRLIGLLNGLVSDGHSMIYMDINEKTNSIVQFYIGTIEQSDKKFSKR